MRLNSPFFLIPIAALILVTVWFKNGNIMGTGESGLPFYDFEIQYKIVETAWFKYGLGGSVNVNFASAPTYFVLWQLQKLGIPNFLLQAAFLWICLVASGWAILNLTKEFFPNSENKYLVAGIFFYWFNPISLVNVWNRFLNNYFIFFAFLPLGLYLFVRGLKTRRFFYSLMFGLSSALFSYVHSSMAFNVLFWFVIFFTTFFYFVISKKKEEKIFVLKYLVVFFLIWFVVNFWWIALVFSYVNSETFSEVTGSFFTDSGNYSSFSDLSQRLGNFFNLLRFTHQDFYQAGELPWFNLYATYSINSINYLITLLIFIGVFIKRKNLSVLFFGLLTILTLLLIKGSNPPFGEIMSFLFLKLPIFQLFRNSFEKFGFILVLALTPLFIFSLQTICNIKWKERLLYWPVLMIILLVWGFPYWTGLVFTANFPPVNNPSVKYEVIVPDDYKLASDWLKNQNGDFRLVVFPLFGEGITYDWQKGFSGIDLSNQLLTRSAVSFDTTVPFYHDVAENIQKVFLEEDKFSLLMNSLNAKYILVREDVDWKARKMIDTKIITKKLEKKAQEGEFKKAAVFGRLSFWENLHYSPTEITVSNNLRVIAGRPLVNDLVEKEPADILVSRVFSENIQDSKTGFSKIYPEKRIVMTEFSEDRYAPQYVFPHVSIYPGNSRYLLILVKEKIQEFFITDSKKKIDYQLQILGKRLKEAAKESEDKNNELLFSSLDRYFATVKEYQQLYKSYLATLQPSQKEELQLEQSEIFYKHLLHLEDLENAYQQQLGTQDKIRNYSLRLRRIISEIEIYPKNELIVSQSFPLTKRLIYKYHVPAKGDYRLLVPDKELLKNFDTKSNESFSIQINDQLKTVVPVWSKEADLDLGRYSLNQGENEISFNVFSARNLVEKQNFDMQIAFGETFNNLPINSLITGRKYNISFDYLIKKGKGPTLLLYGDNSPQKQTKTGLQKVAESYIRIGSDNYDFDKKRFGFTTGNLNGATNAELVFKLEPWNSCENPLPPGQDWCNDSTRAVAYNRQSQIQISNLSVTEEFNEIPFLEKDNLITNSSLKLPEVSYYKISQTKYEINIKNASDKYFLTLAQLYDSGWGLKTEEGKKIAQGPYLANVYQNAWIVEKRGDYKLILEYEPQKKLEFSSKISLISLVIILLILVSRSNGLIFNEKNKV